MELLNFFTETDIYFGIIIQDQGMFGFSHSVFFELKHRLERRYTRAWSVFHGESP